MRTGFRRVGFAAFVTAGAMLAFNVWSQDVPDNALNRKVSPTAIPFAVIGDSNSHSFQDRVAFPAGTGERGGPFHARTFNWTEVLDKLRGKEIDSGPWVVWGSSGLLATGREALGLSGGRAPKKEDFLYNFANSGASCANLMDGRFRQAPRLVAVMDKEPERWKRGVVLIRMGLNDWSSSLDLQSREPDSPKLAELTSRCVKQIGATLKLIHESHPQTLILVAGIANEADDAAQNNNWVSEAERNNIWKALDSFNAGIRKLAESEPNTAFFDDAAWLVQRWGTRGGAPKPAFKTVTIGKSFVVTNSIGDDPHNLLLADDHAGLVGNALWAQSLVARLREAFKLPLTPISDDEVARFVVPLVQPLVQPAK